MNVYNCPIIHHEKIANELFSDMVDNSQKKFSRPNNLAIITAHNYIHKSLFEKSLEHFGVYDYICLHHPEIKDWNHKLKLFWLLSYLKTDNCKEDLVLFCDANDCILIDDPSKIIQIFKEYSCKMLFMSTKMKRGYPDKKSLSFAKKHNKSSSKKTRHLNSGVFVGERRFIIHVLEDLIQIINEIDDNTHPITKSIVNYYDKESSSCPASTYDKIYIPDQNIFRYLYPKYYPDMKIDLDNKLAFRNDSK